MTATSILIAGLIVIAQGQQQPARDATSRAIVGTASISGVVLSDDTDRRPLRRVTVTLGDGRQPVPGTMTDDAGRFTFANLPPGRYSVVATKAGWVSATFGAKRHGGTGTAVVVSDGQRAGPITIAMLRGAVLTGTIRDESGRPISDVGIGVMRYIRSPVDGSRVLMPVNMELGSEPTDDQGVYRFFGLPPGEYLLAAGSGFGAAVVHAVTAADVRRALERRDPTAASRPAPDLSSMKFVPVFYPGAPDASAARPVTVGPGEERSGLDFQIQLVPAAKISGVVTGPDGQPAPNASVTIFRIDQPSMGLLLNWFTNTARSDVNGRFAITGVAPGRYSVQASLSGANLRTSSGSIPAGNLWDYQPIAMAGQDASVALTLHRGPSVSGRLSLVGPAAPTPFPSTRLNLMPVIAPDGPGSMPMPLATIDADGRFAFPSVMPGRYRVAAASIRIGSQTWWPIAALLDGRDLIDEPFDAIGTTDVSGITITYTDRPTELSGLMLDAAGHPAPEYHIVAFSTERSDWRGQSRRIQQVRPGADGRFIFRNLPPGEYFLGAVTDVEDNDWFDPAFLEPLAAASIKLTLAANEQKTQDIRIR